MVVLNAWFPHFDDRSSATFDTLILSFFQLTVKWPLHQEVPFVVLEKEQGTESENPILPGRTTKESVELSYESHCEEEPQWEHRSGCCCALQRAKEALWTQGHWSRDLGNRYLVFVPKILQRLAFPESQVQEGLLY